MVKVEYYRTDPVTNEEVAVPPPHWHFGYPKWWLDLPENKDLHKK